MKSARTAKLSPCSISKPKHDRLNQAEKTAEPNGGKRAAVFSDAFPNTAKPHDSAPFGENSGERKGKTMSLKACSEKEKTFFKKGIDKEKKIRYN